MRTFAKANKLDNVLYDVRGPVVDEAAAMEEKGLKILKLNIGNPAPFGFTAPEEVIQDIRHNVVDCQGYSDSRGIFAARKAVMQYAQIKNIPNVTMKDIYTGNGASELIQLSLHALLNSGDEVLVPSPDYPLWTACVNLAGGKAVHYICDESSDWCPDIEDIKRKITPMTKALVIINPNNPTGALYSTDVLKDMVQVAREHDLIVFSDEIYDRLIMDDVPYDSIAALAPDLPCVTFNGLSKSHAICGFRCGWMVFSGPGLEDVKQGVMQLASMRLCGNALTQLVIPAALEDFASTRAMMVPGGRLYEQRRATMEGLKNIDGLNVEENKAAFYIFPGLDKEKFDFVDDQDFAMQFLHEEKVLVIPGRGFDWHEDLRFRIVMLPEPEELSQAMEKLAAFLNRHRR